jgi:chromosome segregation ATPase
MAAGGLAAWERFYERVVARGGDWPRALWFAAVEDGLKGALSESSQLLAEYRRHIAEWRQLEGSAAGTHRDARRLAQLEADIMRLIGYANQVVRDKAAGGTLQPEPSAVPPEPIRSRPGIWLGAMTAAVILFCGVVLGATYYQNYRMIQQAQRQLAGLEQRLSAEVADRGAALEARLGSVDRVREEIAGLQAELRAGVGEFSQVISESMRSRTAIGSGRGTGPQAAADGDLVAALSDLRTRAAAATRDLGQIEARLASATERLPGLDDDIGRVAAQLDGAEEQIGEVTRRLATLKAQAPQLALSLEGQRQGLATTLEGQRQSVDALDFEIATLKGMLNESRGDFAAVQEELARDLTRTRAQDDELVAAFEELRATQLRAAQVVEEMDVRAAAVQNDLEARVEKILATLAGTVDQSRRRADEATAAAGAEALSRVEAAGARAQDGLVKAGEQSLAELSEFAATTRTELEQTHAGLVAGWRGMDEAVAKRHASVLAGLDRHAVTLEDRVQELLEALDVIVARANNG